MYVLEVLLYWKRGIEEIMMRLRTVTWMLDVHMCTRTIEDCFVSQGLNLLDWNCCGDKVFSSLVLECSNQHDGLRLVRLRQCDQFCIMRMFLCSSFLVVKMFCVREMVDVVNLWIYLWWRKEPDFNELIFFVLEEIYSWGHDDVWPHINAI